MSNDPLLTELRARATTAIAETTGPVADRVGEILDRMDQPLRVAVAGRLKSGKSTLVNTLLRQRIAPVDAGECTRVVTWFRYGPADQIEIRLRDDSRTERISLTPEGRLPTDLGHHHADVDHLDVTLSNRTLDDLTIVDTPGLDSLDEHSAGATERLLAIDEDSQAAVAGADAVIYLMPHLRRDEVDRLREFAALASSAQLSPLRTIAVISKIDKLGDGRAPWDAAHHARERYLEALRGLVIDVVPLIGLLAETADADAFTEADAYDLRLLARVEPARLELALSAPDLFTSADLPVPRGRRRRLLDLLDLYGIRLCLDLIDQGADAAGELVDQLREHSGIAALRGTVDDTFRRRSSALKAHTTIDDLERLTYASTDADTAAALGRLRGELAELRTAPTLHQIRELDALRALWSGELELPEDRARELRRLLADADERARLRADPAAGAADAAERASVWLAMTNDPRSSPALRRVASTVYESYLLLWEELSATTGA